LARHLIVGSAALVLISVAAPLAVAGSLLAAEGAQPAADWAVMRTVLPEAGCGVFVKRAFLSAPADTFVYYAGYRNPDTTALVGYTVTARRRGYASSIVTLAGVGLDGKIEGIRILSQKETQKWGAKIVEAAPARTIADVAEGRAGSAGRAKVAIEVAPHTGQARCFVVEIKDSLALCGIEQALGRSDTSAVTALAPKAFDVWPGDTLLVRNAARAVEVSQLVIDGLREEAVPWWQQQFIGKDGTGLKLAREKSAGSIQAVTGATISSTAVTESVKAAVVTLGEAIGGFRESER
jgi:Na+-translocating ferredoxin:NAD+ oxidoreductase RnfG subunit